MDKQANNVLTNMYTAGDRFGASEMTFYLKRLKEITGTTRQSQIFLMLRYAFENDKRFDDVRDSLKKEWAEMQKP